MHQTVHLHLIYKLTRVKFLERPDGVTTIPWRRGRCVAWDATCPDSYAASHLAHTSERAGTAAEVAELAKRAKYCDLLSSVDFIPIALDTSGVWGKEGLKLMLEIGRRTAEMKNDPRSTAFLLQRISIALQRGNAECVMEMCSSENGNQMDLLDEESSSRYSFY